MHVVDIYRDNLLLFGVKPSDDSTHIKRIMGENELRINFVDSQYIQFKIGDWAEVFGEKFYMNVLPIVTKAKTPGNDYSYQMTLQSTNHILSRVQYLFLGDDNSLKEGEFSLTGKAMDFVELIVNNTKRLLPYFQYAIFEVVDDGYRTLTFSSENCLEALAKIAEAFNTEYWVEGLNISLIKKTRDTGYTFKHGKRKGLYEIIRQTVNNQNVVTRLYAFGSDKNLPEGYRNYSKRLKLPIQYINTVHNVTFSVVDNGNGTQTFTFNFDAPDVPGITFIQIQSRQIGSTGGFGSPQNGLGFLTTRTYTTQLGDYEFIFKTLTILGNFTSAIVQSTGAQPALPFEGDVIYLEKNIDTYGVSESTKFFDEVYPHRTGTVTGVNAGNPYEFTDTDIDFDVNDYLLPGMTAKVTFNSGQLQGYTFDIASFDNGTKKFIVNKNKSERAIDVPSTDFKTAIGDKYVLVDIFLPQSYIDAAEAELQTKAQEELDLLSEPQLTYQLKIDPVYMKEKGYEITIGDLVWIIDSSLQVNRRIRIVSVTRNILNEYDFAIEISDVVSKSTLKTINTKQTNLSNNVSNIQRNFQNFSILNNRVIGDFYINDLPEYADNAAALAAGLTPGQLYKTGGSIRIVF